MAIKVNTPTVMINAGYQINPYFALEGRLGFGVGDDYLGIYTGEIDSYFGGFVRVGYPAHQRFYPYAMLGFGRAKASVSGASTSVSGDDEDFAYGIGANIGFSDSFFGKVEYMNYYDEGIETTSGFTLGLEAKF